MIISVLLIYGVIWNGNKLKKFLKCYMMFHNVTFHSIVAQMQMFPSSNFSLLLRGEYSFLVGKSVEENELVDTGRVPSVDLITINH